MTASSTPGTFAALREPAFRRFYIGQAISLPGTWMQTVAQGWLIIQLTGSATLLGTLTAAQFVPVLLLAPYGGVLADRFPKRRLLILTQATMAATALALGILTVTDRVNVPAVLVAALVLGVATAVDNPTRQSFVVEMVGPDLVRNAVSLNSALLNSARATGPAVAGFVITGIGVGWCFIANAVSFTGIVAALALMSLPAHRPQRGHQSVLRQLREGVRHVIGRQDLLWPCLAMLLVGALAWEFPITLPVLAKDTFGGDARTYGWLTSAMGVGAVFGALFIARRGAIGLAPISFAVAGLGTAVLALALSPSVPVALIALVFVGWTGASYLSISNATLQLSSDQEYRGRVMSLWSLCFIGSTPIGGPVIGAVAEHASPRWALLLGALACFLASLTLHLVRRSRTEQSGR